MTLPFEITDILATDNFNMAWLVSLPGGLNYTTHNRDLLIAGITYEAGGYILKIPPITRESEIKLSSLTVSLSASEAIYTPVNGTVSLYDLLYNGNQTGGACLISLILIDPATGLEVTDSGGLGLKVDMYKGYFDGWSYRDGGSSETIDVKITSPWAKPVKTAGRLTNPSDQQAAYPGDKFFEFAHEEKINIGWGKEA